MKTITFPEHFMFGTATAGLQIEGGCTNNNWYRFCEQGKTLDQTHCFVAADHWHRYEEDIALMKQLHQQTYRLGIEWSRIEPSPGQFDEEAIAHYRKIIAHVLAEGIHPLVTIYHFTNPLWFEDMGGWTNKDAVLWFNGYVRKVIHSFGDIVQDWVTINEPNVYVEGTYSSAIYPPNKANFAKYFIAAKHLITAHIEAYQTIHEIREEQQFKGQTRVGVAHHLRVFATDRGRKSDDIPRKMMDHIFHKIFLEGMTRGKYLAPIGNNHYPLGQGIYADFIGVNYYSRDIIHFSPNPLRVFGKLTVKKDAPTNDLGWEIFAEGLYEVCKKVYDTYKLPIYITENGICDATDSERPQFIYDHLAIVARLIEDGVPVERYYHWSLIDNFEWELGLTPRFGFIHVDYETLERTIRPSGHFYGEIAEQKKITSELLTKYAIK